MGVSDRIFSDLAAQDGPRYADDRCDTSQSSQDGGEFAEKGVLAPYQANQGWTEHQAARRV